MNKRLKCVELYFFEILNKFLKCEKEGSTREKVSERESILKQTPKKPGDMQHGFIENTLIHRTRHTITIQSLPASQANKKVPVANSMKHCYLNCKFLELHFLLCIKLSEENRTIIFLDRWAFTLLHPRHITGEQTFPYNTILEHKDFNILQIGEEG